MMRKPIVLLIVSFLFSARVISQELKLVVPSAHPQRINSVLVDKQGMFLYTFDDSKCIMWNIATGKQLHTFETAFITGYDLNPDGTKLILSSKLGVNLFNTENGKLIKFFPTSKYNYNAIFTEDGSKIIGTNEEGEIDLIELSDFSSTVFISEYGSMFNSQICLLPDQQFSIINQGKIRTYDLRTKQRIFELESDRSEFKLFRFAGQILKNGNFYDLRTGQIVKKIEGQILDNSFKERIILPSNNSNDLVLVGLYKQFEKSIPELFLFETEHFTKTADFKNPEYPDYFMGGYFDQIHQTVYLIAMDKIIAYDMLNQSYKKLAQSDFANFGSGIFSTSSVNKIKNSLDVISNYTNAKSIDLNRLVPESHRNIKVEPFGYCTSITGDTTALFQYGDSLTIKSSKNNKTICKTKEIISSDKGSLASHDDGCFFFSQDGKFLYYFLMKYPDVNYELTRYSLKDGIQTPVGKFKRMGKQFFVSADRKIICGFETQIQNNAFVYDISTKTRIFQLDLGLAKIWTPSTVDQYIAVSDDKTRVLIAKGDGYYLFDLKTKNLIVDKKPITPLFEYCPRAASSTLNYFIAADVNQRNIFVYSDKGEEIYKLPTLERKALSIHFSSNNDQFFVISEDNTIKAFETATGKLLGTLYIFKETNDFVFVAPDGRFDGTQDGMKKLYYLKNREIYPLEILMEKYYTPNLYVRLINGEVFPIIPDNDIRSKPTAKIQYAEKTRNLEVDNDNPLYLNTTGVAEITILATAPDDAIDEIRLFHNGKIVTLTTRNLIVVDENKNNSATKKYTVNLLNGFNYFRAVALNTQRTESIPDEIVVTYSSVSNIDPSNNTPAESNTNQTIISPVDKNATLHLVVVGINQYENKSMALNYALADATAFKDEIEKDAKSIITNIKTYFVTDNTANKSGITGAFGQVQATAKPQDIFVFYYAGHGVIGKDKEFYLVPNDVSDLKNVQAELETKGIPAKLLQQYAIDIPAQKQLFILDACQSAGAFNEMLSADGDQQKSIAVVSRSTGTHWMAASGAQQYANEFSQLGHGAFTYVLLEALKGSAAADKMITVNGLKSYLQQGVPELMKKYSGTLQYPASYGFGNDFPVEILK
jgi:WD40 repeat protein